MSSDMISWIDRELDNTEFELKKLVSERRYYELSARRETLQEVKSQLRSINVRGFGQDVANDGKRMHQTT